MHLARNVLLAVAAAVVAMLVAASSAAAVTPRPAEALPPSFSWGVAGSAYQSEGGFTNSNWDIYAARPGNDPYGASVDFRHRYRQDIALAKAMGVTQFRFGINWARVEPRPGVFDQHELAYYDDLMQAVVDAGMRPQPTLDHWVYPRWVYDQGAWNNPKTVDDFLDYVRVMAERYKDRHAAYLTFNEAFFYEFSEQARRPGNDAALMSRHLIEAHRRAYDLIHAVDPTAEVSSNVVWVSSKLGYAAQSDAGFLDGVTDKLDFIGFDYYYESTGDAGLGNIIAGTPWKTPQYPQDMYVALHELSARFPHLPIYITENGMATDDGLPRADGWTRSQAMADTVYWIQRAWAEGIDVRGYQYWSLTDNYEFGSYAPRFGLYTVDALTDPTLTRRPTDAVATYKSIIADRGVSPAYRPKLIRCSDSDRELTCPDTPDLPVVRGPEPASTTATTTAAPVVAPPATPSPAVVAARVAPTATLRVRRVRGGSLLTTTVRGGSATLARLSLVRAGRIVASRRATVRGGKATATFRVHRGGTYAAKARIGSAIVRSAGQAVGGAR